MEMGGEMGTIIILDYSSMRAAGNAANQAAKKCENYAGKINSKICKKLGSLPMGGNGNTSQADYFARAKIGKLNEKKSKYEEFSRRIYAAESYAKSADKRVSSYIKRESEAFRNANDMKTNIIQEFFTWTTTTLLNSTAFGRWLNQAGKTVGSWMDTAKRTFRNFYELCGGKYIITAVLTGVGAVLAAVALVCVAWPALVTAAAAIASAGLAGLTGGMIWTAVTAAAGVVTAIAAVADGVTKSAGNFAAVTTFLSKDDPGWANRHGSYTSFTDFLRKNNFHNSALDKLSFQVSNVADVVTMSAQMINIADIVKRGYKVLTNLKDEHIAAKFSKPKFKLTSGKVTAGSVKYGLKHVKSNIVEVRKLISSTNISRLTDFQEKSMKLYDSYKSLKTANKIVTSMDSFAQKFSKKGLIGAASGTALDEIKKSFIVYKQVYSPADKIRKNIKNMTEAQNRAKLVSAGTSSR